MSTSETFSTRIPCVLHGSFRKNLEAMQSAKQTLESTELVEVIAPTSFTATEEENGFVLLTGEEDKDPREVELAYLQKVLGLRALGGFSLWINPDGYVGKSAAYEYGIAQACGVPAFFTDVPDDVPFYIDPDSIKSPDELAEYLYQNQGQLPDTHSHEPLALAWQRLAFPTAAVAVGGIIRCRNEILLVHDGRWQNNQLTIPGTTVLPIETRDQALQRLFADKISISPRNVAHFETNFIINGSGYNKPIGNMVFDDYSGGVSSSKIRPQPNIIPYWMTPSEVESATAGDQVEPNAAWVLTKYLEA